MPETLIQACNFIEKESLPQVFSYELSLPFITEHLLWFHTSVCIISKNIRTVKVLSQSVNG